MFTTVSPSNTLLLPKKTLAFLEIVGNPKKKMDSSR